MHNRSNFRVFQRFLPDGDGFDGCGIGAEFGPTGGVVVAVRPFFVHQDAVEVEIQLRGSIAEDQVVQCRGLEAGEGHR